MMAPIDSLTLDTWISSVRHQDGPVAEAGFSSTNGICVSEDGLVYVTDGESHYIRCITLGFDAHVTTIAGCGKGGDRDGPALTAELKKPTGICMRLGGGLIFVEEVGCKMRTLFDGYVTTVIGKDGAGMLDGPVEIAKLRSPRGVCQGPDGTIYIADNGNHRIRCVDVDGMVTSIGNGQAVTQDGPWSSAAFLYPSSVCVTPRGCVYVGELYRVRKVDVTNNLVTTFENTHETSLTAGICPSPYFDHPDSNDGNRIFYTDSNGARLMCVNEAGQVLKIAPNVVTGNESRLMSPRGLAFTPDGDLLLCDSSRLLRIIRGVYPPLDTAWRLTRDLTFAAAADLDVAKITPHNASNIIPFHPQLAELAYPSLAHLKPDDVERARNFIEQRTPPILLTSNTQEIPPAATLEAKLLEFYESAGSNPRCGLSSLISSLYLAHLFAFPKEIITSIMRKLTQTLDRVEISPTKLGEFLCYMATEDLYLKQAAIHMFDRVKRIIEALNSTLLSVIEQKIGSTYPKYFEFLTALFSDPHMHPSRRFTGLPSYTPNRVIFPPHQAKKDEGDSAAAIPASNPMQTTLTGDGRPKFHFAPYLIQRMRGLFWFKVVSPEMLAQFPSLQVVALQEGGIEIDPEKSPFDDSNDPLLQPSALKPNFKVIVEDKPILLHDWVLLSRWPWFRHLIQSGFGESLDCSATLPPGTLSYNSFIAFAYYLYCGSNTLFNPALAAELLEHAEQFRLTEPLSQPPKPEPEFKNLIGYCTYAVARKPERKRSNSLKLRH